MPPPPSLFEQGPEPTREERLKADLADKVPGLERLAEVPGVVPTEEQPVPGPGEPGYEAVFGDAAGRLLGWRELLLAAVAFLLLAAVPLRSGLTDPGTVQFGVDRALEVEPWVGHAAAVEGAAPANAGLSDQALVFYPFMRWVSASWRSGDAPWWNPLIYCGAPALGNPQAGVLDPQVLVPVALEAAFGIEGFHWGLSLMAWLRIGLAALGAYALARRLGLGTHGAALAGVAFGFSGYLVLWLNFPLGHVPPFLPWLLFFLEGLASPGAGEVSPWPRRRAFAGAALCLLGAILGGHPETSFFVGATAGLWSLALLARDRGAGWRALGALALGAALGGVVLWPFYEYLSVSGAQAIRSAGAETVGQDPVSLGLLLLVGVLVWGVARALGAARIEDELDEELTGDEHPAALPAWRRWVGLGTLHGALAVLVGGGLLVLFARGLEERFFLTFLFDLWGRPGTGDGYTGPGSGLLESGSTYLVGAALAACAAAVLQRAMTPPARDPLTGMPKVAAPGGLRRPGLVLGLAGLTLGLALGLPGLVELWRLVPLVGLGDTVRFASVSALMLALLAGEGLERARGPARGAAVLAVLVAAGLAVLADRTPPDPFDGQPNTAGLAVDGEGELLGFATRPGERLAPRREALVGWLHPDLDLAGARLVAQRLRPEGVPPRAGAVDRYALPLVLGGEAPSAEAAADAPPGATWFRSVDFQTGRLDEGWWGLGLELLGPGSAEPVATRDLGRHLVERDLSWSPVTVGLFLAGLAVLVLPLTTRRRGELLVLLAALQALHFAEDQNPAHPAAAVFPETATERILADELGVHRYLSAPGVLPPDTGLVRGLRSLDGYDALDPASYNDMRPFALLPGVHPLLGWNAHGVDLASPVFRMLGVKCLVTATPLDPARLAAAPGGWAAIARPPLLADDAAHPDGLRSAETWIYRAAEPFPRAWCVTAAVGPDAVQRDVAAWDPRTTAILLEPWSPAAPATGRVLADPVWTNTTVELELEVTGPPGSSCLLVLSEQAFPGTTIEVDGAPREVRTANGLFVAVELGPGDRVVRLAR